MLSAFSSFAARRAKYNLRWYATAQKTVPVTETTKANASLNRFWKKAEISADTSGYRITLDGRPIRTPSNNTLHIPHDKRVLAALIAHEWDVQDKILKTHTLPMTSLAARAIDAFNDPEIRSDARKEILKYLSTDTICFPEERPEALVELQTQYWTPILNWVKTRHRVEIQSFDSVFRTTQRKETIDHFNNILESMDIWTLAGKIS